MAFCQIARTFSNGFWKISTKQITSTHQNVIQNQISKALPFSLTSVRCGSYNSSPLIDKVDLSAQPNIEITNDPTEWKFVEAILPPSIAATPTPKEKYTSGWTPQTVDPKRELYLVRRTKNHMIPVYLKILFRGTKRVTVIRHIQGDVFALEAELTAFLEDYLKKKFIIRVNEFSGEIVINGDYVNLVKHFLQKRGF